MESDAPHFLLTAASIWTDSLQVLGVFSSEQEALEAANWDRLAAADASPVRFTIAEWVGTDCVRSMTSSPPFAPEGGPTAGWSGGRR